MLKIDRIKAVSPREIKEGDTVEHRGRRGTVEHPCPTRGDKLHVRMHTHDNYGYLDCLYKDDLKLIIP
jgi:hypothetical protein